jgi:hypothetical protein
MGDDGASELIAVDMRDPAPPVVAVNNVSAGWDHAVIQADSLEQFLRQVEDGTFAF